MDHLYHDKRAPEVRMINQVVLFDMDLKAGLTLADTLVTDEHVRFLVVQRQSDITGSTTEVVGYQQWPP
jgi:hypothetical protein